MRVSAKKLVLFAALCAGVTAARADEIKLKDGKKLYGVIVGYEDNMFRVKTEFGFVLVEKDKIAAIVPTTTTGGAPAPATAATAKPPVRATSPKPEASVPPAEETASNESPEPSKSKISASPVRPSLPAAANASKVTPPATKSNAEPNTGAVAPAVAAAQPLAQPKEPEAPANREEVQGNLYTNFSHGFKMYKAPSWELIEDARQALPNAIVAMGTSNESTLMVVGQEKAKDALDGSAAAVEKRLRDIYSSYRLVSQRKTVVGGSPAVEYKFTGKADEHDWSGTLVVIERGKEVLTMLGMTYANSDLIQIQENVIAKAIASTSFDVPKFSAEK